MNYKTLALSRSKRDLKTELKRQRKLKLLLHNTDARYYYGWLADVETVNNTDYMDDATLANLDLLGLA